MKKVTAMIMGFILIALVCMPVAMAASQAPIVAEIQASVGFSAINPLHHRTCFGI